MLIKIADYFEIAVAADDTAQAFCFIKYNVQI